jgi:hypothetical protein
MDFFGFGLNEEKNEALRIFYGRVLSQLITIVFDVLYDFGDDDEDDEKEKERDDDDDSDDNSDIGDDDNKAMTSVRSTFSEQIKQRYHEDVEQEDFFEDNDNDNNNNNNNEKKAKGKGKQKPKPKPKPKPKRNEYRFGFKVDIYLKGYAMIHYPLAKQLKEQGIIDEYEFYNKFPLAREIDLQKEQQQMAKQQMKMNKESQDAKFELDKKSINNDIAVNNQSLKLEQQKLSQNTSPSSSAAPSPQNKRSKSSLSPPKSNTNKRIKTT